jgi:hypothetical protein
MSYPYSLKLSSLQEFIEKIQTIGVPDKINTRTLPSLGYKAKNDRAIPRILKFIGFLDEKGIPNENYKAYRNRSQAGFVMARQLKSAYNELFSLYPDACERSETELNDYFRSKTTAGDKVVKQTTLTFKTLCNFADFSGTQIQEELSLEKPPPEIPLTIPSLPITINIQIQLPLTEKVEVYDKIFEALRKNLIDRDQKSD